MSQLRRDPISRRWVIIAPERAKRPQPNHAARAPLIDSPFRVGNEAATGPELRRYLAPDAPEGLPWSVRVVPNKYPALRVEGALEAEGDGIHDAMNGVGAHELVIEAPSPSPPLGERSRDHIATVLRAWRERLRDLRRDERLMCAMIFKNSGAAAGASISHPHSQLIALPFVPPELARELEGAQAYHDFRGRCVFCDIARQERREQVRLVHDNGAVEVIAPYASRVPFELWLLPRRHAAAFESCDDAELLDVAAALKVALDKLGRALDGPPYNMVLHSAPFGHEDSPHYHWHIELLPHLAPPGGFELASGCHINPTAPEEAARHLREMD